jgi:hypothetical protein
MLEAVEEAQLEGRIGSHEEAVQLVKKQFFAET